MKDLISRLNRAIDNEYDAKNNEIDAITASTITSKAVTKGVNIAIDDFTENFSK